MRERVVRGVPPAQILLLNLVLGMALVGPSITWLDQADRSWALRVGPLPYSPTLHFSVATFVLLFVIGEAFIEQRFRRAWQDVGLLVAGTVFVPLGFCLAGDLYSPGRALGNWAFFAAHVVILRLAAIVFVRTFIRRLIVQTGTLCWYCGYDLRGSPSEVCSECGRSEHQEPG